MKTEDQVRAIAELHGYIWTIKVVGLNLFSTQLSYAPEGGLQKEIKTYGCVRAATREEIQHAVETGQYIACHPNYHESLDAIVPVIVKWCDRYVKQAAFMTEVRGFVTNDFSLFKLTPTQLCEALLRAAGKWTE